MTRPVHYSDREESMQDTVVVVNVTVSLFTYIATAVVGVISGAGANIIGIWIGYKMGQSE